MQRINTIDTISCRSVLAGKYVRNLTYRCTSGEQPFHHSIVEDILADGRQKDVLIGKMKNTMVEMIHSSDDLSKINYFD